MVTVQPGLGTDDEPPDAGQTLAPDRAEVSTPPQAPRVTTLRSLLVEREPVSTVTTADLRRVSRSLPLMLMERRAEMMVCQRTHHARTLGMDSKRVECRFAAVTDSGNHLIAIKLE